METCDARRVPFYGTNQQTAGRERHQHDVRERSMKPAGSWSAWAPPSHDDGDVIDGTDRGNLPRTFSNKCGNCLHDE